MINLIWDDTFKRKYKKLIKNNEFLKNIFWKKIELFIENPYNPQLKTHKLSGKLKNCYSFALGFDFRVVFQFVDNESVLLIDIGSHDEVY